MINRVSDYLNGHEGEEESASVATETRTSPILPEPQEMIEATANWVQEHPGAALTTAFIVGLFFGWMVKR